MISLNPSSLLYPLKLSELLATDYPKVKQGLLDKRILDQKFAELGLEETPTLNENLYKSFGDEYIVDYRGEKRKLDIHLKKGVARDQRRCLRIYYFWCEESEQVVVGSLLSHLRHLIGITTSQT